MANFEPFKCIELFFVPWQVVYKYCDKSFVNKPTFFFNFVPQLIKKTYRADTTWFYRFTCAIGAQAHIFLMTRLTQFQSFLKLNSLDYRGVAISCLVKLYFSVVNSYIIQPFSFELDILIWAGGLEEKPIFKKNRG